MKEMPEKQQCYLDISWDMPSPDSPKLPSQVGPFDSRQEAEEWAALNIKNAEWSICLLAWPYRRARPWQS